MKYLIIIEFWNHRNHYIQLLCSKKTGSYNGGADNFWRKNNPCILESEREYTCVTDSDNLHFKKAAETIVKHKFEPWAIFD